MTAPTAASRWLGGTKPERFEVMTRWSLYSVFALIPVVAMATLAGEAPHPGSAVLTFPLVVGVQTVCAIRVFVPAIRVYSDGAPWPRTRLWWLVGSTAACVLVAFTIYPGVHESIGRALLVPFAGVVMAVTPLVRRLWTIVACGLASGVLASIAQVAVGAPPPRIIPTLIIALVSIPAVAISCRLSVWMLKVVWELDEARATAARLAVAEERLRFSRDLHDVFGRTLSTVAVKSELAAALAERGDPRGVEEMLAVRQLAHAALREVRGVVQGYRSADLDTEISGARELLRAAGVECRVAGVGLALPAPVAEAAAWVVREAVTNVVRHSSASRCEITVRVTDVCRVTVTNDGAPPGSDRSSSGSGLRGLRERLQARDGTLTVAQSDGEFTVSAQIDLGEESQR